MLDAITNDILSTVLIFLAGNIVGMYQKEWFMRWLNKR